MDASELALVVPVALLEADDPESRLCEPSGDDASGCSGTDDEDICWVDGQGSLLVRKGCADARAGKPGRR
jgi:hypothetical protein